LLFGKSTPAILAIIILDFYLLYNGLLSLTHFELRVLLADNVETAFASYDLAIFTALFDGCLDFHIMIFFYLYLKEMRPLVKS